MPRHVFYELRRKARTESCRLLAPPGDELASLRVARDSLHAFPADFGKSQGAGFDVYVGGAVARVQNGGRFPRIDLDARREVAILCALAGFFLGELRPAGQQCDFGLAACSRGDVRQHGARALAEIEDCAVLEFYLRLPSWVDRQYVSVSQPDALGGGVERSSAYQLDAPFGQRQGARGLSKSGSAGAQ